MTAPLIGPVSSPELHVMTFNIRRRLATWRRADQWSRRRRAVAALLRSERPTVLGLQEAMPDQTAFVHAELGGAYRFVGRGRDAHGGGEACPLFFDSDRLELLDWAQSALSEHPDVPGSRSWGNAVPRIAVSATLADRTTGATMRVVNTHLDPFSRASRSRSAAALRRGIEAQPLPAILMGDLNAAQRSRAVRDLLSDSGLRDAWDAAATRLTPAWGTFPDYRAPRRGAKRIDWIMASPGVRIVSAAINVRRYDSAWPSDHAPVQAVVRIEQSEGAE